MSSTSYQQGTPYQVSQEVTKPVEDLIIGMEGLEGSDVHVTIQ